MVAPTIRHAREDDLERLVEIRESAYPNAGGYHHHRRRLTHSAFGGLDNVRVVEKEGELVACAALFFLELWLGGRPVPVGGIGSVAVAPEARRRGLARVLLDALHAEIEAERGAFGLLYPFRHGFYAEHGYATTSPLVSLVIAIDAIERIPSLEAGPADLSPARIDAPLLAEAREVYHEVARASAGRLTRTEARWMKLFSVEPLQWMGVVSDDGKLQGYTAFSYEPGATEREPKIVVRELTARNGPARRALLRALANQRDQVVDVELVVPYGDPLVLVLEDAAGVRRGTERTPHPIGVVSAGPMVRMIDARRALALRGYASDGDVTFRCTDGLGPLRVSVRRGSVEIVNGAATLEVELSSGTLASIAAAGMRPTEAAELGLLRASSEALRKVEDMFAGPRFHCLDPF